MTAEKHRAEAEVPEILVVDDLPENLKTLAAMLKNKEYKVRFAQNGTSALKNIAIKVPDLILLDIRMPDMDGYEVCQRIKSNPASQDVPVIFISALSDTLDKVKAFQVGGVDYVTKPFNPDEVLARIRTHLHIRRLQRELQQYSGTLEDMVQERTTELRASRDRYSRFVEGLPVGVFRAEPRVNGRLLMANPAAMTMLGIQSADELHRLSLADFDIGTVDQQQLQEKLVREGKIRNYELSLSRRDGTKLIAKIAARLVVDQENSPQYFDGVMEDVTEWREAEDAKTRLESQLRQAQKMEAIGTLAGGIAHDFNNMLAAIMGHTELAIQEALEHGRPIRGLKEVMNASLRAKDLIGQILSFSRKRQVEVKPVQVKPICKEVLKLLKASLPTTIEIRHDLTSDAMIMANPVEIHQVLMNLTTNSAHAMEGTHEGVLDVRLSDVDIDEHFAAANQITPGRYQKLSITDNGVGIKPEVIERIFEPFYSTKGDAGTGLGLSVVHGIVKSFDGTITVYSEPGMGATFNVYWPIARVVDKQPFVVSESDLPRGSNEMVLCVDDEEIMLGVMQRLLTWLGYQVTTMQSSNDALELFRAEPHRFDLVITDQTMPKMTGEVLAAQMVALRPDIPVILCTGNMSIQLAEESRNNIRKIIMKPLLLRDVALAVREVVDGARNDAV